MSFTIKGSKINFSTGTCSFLAVFTVQTFEILVGSKAEAEKPGLTYQIFE